MRPLCLAGNAAVILANAGALATSRTTWRTPLPPRAGPRVIYTWHRFNFLAALALRSLPEAERPALLMHDGLASRALTHESSTWLGYEVFVFARRSKTPVREQIAQYLRHSNRDLLMLPDAGGPYGKMKPGIIEIARSVSASLVPLALHATRAVEVGATLRHVVPLPFCEFVLSAGAELRGDALDVERCQAALEACFARA